MSTTAASPDAILKNNFSAVRKIQMVIAEK